MVELWRYEAILKDSLCLSDFVSEMFALDSELYGNREGYAHSLIREVGLLRREVMELVKLRRLGKKAWSHTSFQEDINQQILSTKVKHAEIEKSLSKEWAELNNDLLSVSNQYIGTDQQLEQFEGGVTEEVWSGECPSDSLRENMSKEFATLDKHFTEQIESFDKQHSSSMQR